MGSPDFYVNSSDFLIWHFFKHMYWYINFVLSKKKKKKKKPYTINNLRKLEHAGD